MARRLLIGMPRHGTVVALSLISVQMVLFILPASAVCRLPHPKVNAEFFKRDAVFVGTVLAERDTPVRGNEYDGWIYKLSVRRVFRGSVKHSVEVFTENSSGRYPLERGKTYLLFATSYAGRLEIDNCSNSALLSEARDAIGELEKLKNPGPYGEIEGRIDLQPSESPAGIRIIVQNGRKTYSAITDGTGWFTCGFRQGSTRFMQNHHVGR